MKNPSRKVINRQAINVKIRSRQKTVFDGQVKAISSENKKGIFDILPQHVNFISIIKKEIVLHTQRGAKQKIPIESAILKVWGNQVDIYLDVSSPLSQE